MTEGGEGHPGICARSSTGNGHDRSAASEISGADRGAQVSPASHQPIGLKRYESAEGALDLVSRSAHDDPGRHDAMSSLMPHE